MSHGVSEEEFRGLEAARDAAREVWEQQRDRTLAAGERLGRFYHVGTYAQKYLGQNVDLLSLDDESAEFARLDVTHFFLIVRTAEFRS